jgi:hypothetical protein
MRHRLRIAVVAVALLSGGGIGATVATGDDGGAPAAPAAAPAFAPAGAAEVRATAVVPASRRVRATPGGVGTIKLGARYSTLRAAGRLGALRQGCELAGPGARSARLNAPLRGTVDLTHDSPRRVSSILISGGAAARGIGVGATSARVRVAFPKAQFDHSTDDLFGITVVRVPRSAGGRMQFAIDTVTHRVTAIGIPFVAFCD